MFISLIRTVILYLVVILVMRLLGKRQIGELEASELAVTILISELAAVPMQDSAQPLLSAVVPIFVLLALGVLTSTLTLVSPRLRGLIHGKPSIIIRSGQIDQRELRRLRLNMDEVTEELRLANVNDLNAVRYAIVETNGQLSVILQDGDTPVTRRDMQITSPQSPSLPHTLISNGRLLRHNLKRCGMTMDDLARELEKRRIERIRDVFYMSCDDSKTCRVIRSDDA